MGFGRTLSREHLTHGCIFLYNTVIGEINMSHFSKDLAIDGIVDDIGAMGDMDVVKALNPSNLSKVSKFVGNNINGANIMDYARDVLADQMYDDWANMPSPHG